MTLCKTVFSGCRRTYLPGVPLAKLLAVRSCPAKPGSPSSATQADYRATPTLFEEYGFSRPQMLADWRYGLALPKGRWTPTEIWQRRLWLELFGPDALLDQRAKESGTRYRTLAQVVSELGGAALAGDRPVFLFGVSYVAAAYQQVLSRVATRGELFVYTLNPCMEFWEDLQTGRERAKRDGLPRRGQKIDPATLDGDDPFGLAAPGDDPPALALEASPAGPCATTPGRSGFSLRSRSSPGRRA